MKFVREEEHKYILYLNKFYCEDINFDDPDNLEDYFKEMLITFKNKYLIDIKGYYEMIILNDSNYGVIIIMKKYNFDYLDFIDNQINLEVKFEKNHSFLYKIDDLFILDKSIINNIIMYKYKDGLYVKIIKPLDFINLGKLLEFGIIIYGEIVNNIINKGDIINV